MEESNVAATALAELSRAVQAAGSVPLSCMSREDVGRWINDLQSIRSSFDALVCSSTASAHDAAVQVDDSLRSVPAFVAARTNADPKVIAGDRADGTWLQGFPTFAAAFAEGSLTRRHIRALRAEDNARTNRLLYESQVLLTAAGRDCSWREFVDVLRYWVLAADPDGDEPDAQAERRRFNVTKRPDGMVSGSFLLDGVVGEMLRNAIDQETQRLRRAELEGDAEEASAEAVTPAQRRADALANLVGRGAARPDGSVPAPLVHIVMSERVASDILLRMELGGTSDDPIYREACERLGIDPDRLPLDPVDLDARCELVDGTPIHPRAAAAVLSVAALRRLIMSAPSEVLDLGRAVRCYPRPLKDAMLAASRGRCGVVNCDAPVGWLEADHRLPWSSLAPTALANGDILCRPHNLIKSNRPPP